jgi:hypothetical protein
MKKNNKPDPDEEAFANLREAFTRMRNGDKSQAVRKQYKDALVKLGLEHKYPLTDRFYGI